jgi:uncharacterized oxidoreductase
MKLSGHKVLVTGGTSGIGLELARQFVDRDNRVVICGRNMQKLSDARNELGDVEILQADLSVPDQIPMLASEAAKRLGGLSILVNNAGIQYNYSFADADLSQIANDTAREIQVNLNALIALTAACLPVLRTVEVAAVVNVSSALAITPKASAPVYCATKAAIHSFSQALRYQMQDALPTVRVFEVMPPLVDTEMTHGRGSGKISARQVADQTFAGLERDRYEILVGKAKLLRAIKRFSPSFGARILRDS